MSGDRWMALAQIVLAILALIRAVWRRRTSFRLGGTAAGGSRTRDRLSGAIVGRGRAGMRVAAMAEAGIDTL